MNITLIIGILLVLSGFSVFCWYISPDRNSEPSKAQAVLATCWLIFRRFVCFTGAIFFLYCFYPLWASQMDVWYKLVGTIVLAAMSFSAVFAAIFGQGRWRWKITDDFIQYKKTKKKYGWRW